MQYIIFIRRSLLLLVLLGAWCLWAAIANAETSITNSVRVSADSTGESHAEVTTVIDGEVVEDWSASSSGEPIEYSHSVGTTTTTVVYSNNTSPVATQNDEELKVIISQLEALISLYVSLLQS